MPALGLRWIFSATLCALTACQQPAVEPEPAPVAGIGYLVFNAPIAPASRDIFIADVDKLQTAGAKEIHLGINSPGGDIDAAQGIVDYMNRLHAQNGVTFTAYNLQFVASAATFVFLNAQTRYSTARSAFLFHAAGVRSNATVSAEGLREEAAKLDAYERVVTATLKARTKLTDDEARIYVRRTVVLNADDARRDGIVDGIATFVVPKGARSWLISARPANISAPNPLLPLVGTPPA